jgi:spore germination cell wall hydrolase CwlJ-like protein
MERTVLIIKNRILKVTGTLALIGVIVPTNIFVYATTGVNNVEQVSSIMEVSTLEAGIYDNTSELKNGLNKVVDADIAKLTDTDVSSQEEYSLVFGEELAEFNIVLISKDDEDILNEKFDNLGTLSTDNLDDYNVVEILDEKGQEELEAEKQARAEEEARLAEQKRLEELQSEAQLLISNPDANYEGHVVELSDSDRDLVERLIMGESGGIDLTAAGLVAQTIRDTMYYKGFTSVQEVRSKLKYSGSIYRTPNEYVKQAVKIIFDQGGYMVRHKLFYFYAPKIVNSSWHEKQEFVVEYGGHRYFSTW